VIFEPKSDFWVLVRGIVIYDQMEIQLFLGLLINRFEKTDEFLMAITLHRAWLPFQAMSPSRFRRQRWRLQERLLAASTK
jgi:hypothetical protein